MGAVFELSCARCGYESIWEMWIAHSYREKHNTFSEIENGVWGANLQRVMQDEKNEINMEVYMYVCDKCKRIEICPSLAYRICNKKLKATKFESPKLILEERRRHKREDYSEWVKYHHICDECGEEMREIHNPAEEGPIMCPGCGRELTAEWTGIS